MLQTTEKSVEYELANSLAIRVLDGSLQGDLIEPRLDQFPTFYWPPFSRAYSYVPVDTDCVISP